MLPEATFVHVDAGFLYEGETSPVPRGVLDERRFLALDLISGRVDDRAPIYPYLAEHGLTAADLQWFRENAVTPDVIGVNYYPRFSNGRLEDGAFTPVRSDARGLRTLVELYTDRYRLPIAITETSLVGTAEEKIEWLRESAAEIAALRSEGHDIVGFTWFPFFTMVDWLYRFDHRPADEWFMEFGIVDLRRGADQVLERVPNPAFAVFQELAQAARS